MLWQTPRYTQELCAVVRFCILIFFVILKFVSFSLILFHAGGQTSKCILVGDLTNDCDLFCESKTPENITCRRMSLFSQKNTYEDDQDKSVLTRIAVGDECCFAINLVVDDIGSVLDCRLDSEIRLSLAFVTGRFRTEGRQIAIGVLRKFLFFYILGEHDLTNVHYLTILSNSGIGCNHSRRTE